MKLHKNDRGFSLAELLMAIVIFSILMLLTSQAFKVILSQSSGLFKSAESNIEGIVGLEMLRKDVAQAGFGLPWSIQDSYSSVTAVPETLPVTLTQIQSMNDTPKEAPRAVGSIDNAGYNGSDYLVIKSTVVAMNNTVKKGAILRQKDWSYNDSSPALALSGNEAVTVINPTFSPEGKLTDKRLIGREFFRNVTSQAGPYRPKNPYETYLVYGLDDSKKRAPFNRADYFIHRPSADTKVPDVCAKVVNTATKGTNGIGILYKAVMNQANGALTFSPLLDCVADMQVVYGLDLSDPADGVVDFHASELKNGGTPKNAETIRAQLKEVRIYVLAQDGKKDTSYTYPNSTIYVGGFESGRLFDFASSNIKDWQHYRWKIYTIVVQPSL